MTVPDGSERKKQITAFGQLLQFGIPSLDGLFGVDPEASEPRLHGMRVDAGFNGRSETTSICIAGPSGTGKSILGLHLASYYRAQHGDSPRIIYASTDFSWAKANTVWRKFKLATPQKRESPFLPAGSSMPKWVIPGTAVIRLTSVATSEFWQGNSDTIRCRNR